MKAKSVRSSVNLQFDETFTAQTGNAVEARSQMSFSPYFVLGSINPISNKSRNTTMRERVLASLRQNQPHVTTELTLISWYV